MKKNKVGVKNLKNGPKSGREKGKLPVKKIKKSPKIAFMGTFYFHGKKKHCLILIQHFALFLCKNSTTPARNYELLKNWGLGALDTKSTMYLCKFLLALL